MARTRPKGPSQIKNKAVGVSTHPPNDWENTQYIGTAVRFPPKWTAVPIFFISAADLPVISLDALRAEMDVDPADNQGAVAKAAKDQVMVYLRNGQSFVWNATNITRELRQQLIALFANYKARIKVVYVECPLAELHRRNRARQKPVPTTVIDRMIEKLEIPTVTESHQLFVAIA